jgi:hypothetical protein
MKQVMGLIAVTISSISLVITVFLLTHPPALPVPPPAQPQQICQWVNYPQAEPRTYKPTFEGWPEANWYDLYFTTGGVPAYVMDGDRFICSTPERTE